MAAIKNIIFDLGGVLLHISPQKTMEAFVQLGLPHGVDAQESQALFAAMEQGRLSNDDFRAGVNALLPKPQSPDVIDAAWNAMLLHFNTARIAYLKELSKQYKVFLFSNTNSIHADCFEQKFFDSYQYAIHELFHESFYSHTLGLRKPKAAAFQKVLSLAKITPQETIFVDDLPENCQAAQDLEIKSLCLSMNDNLEEKLNEYLQG